MLGATGIDRWLVELGRKLRAAGVDVNLVRLQTALQALGTIDAEDEQQAYWALRCALTSRREHATVFDAVLAGLGRTLPGSPATAPDLPGGGEQAAGAEAVDVLTAGECELGVQSEEAANVGRRASAEERLRKLDLGRWDDDDLQAARRLIDRVSWSLPRRSTRRREPASQPRMLDARRTAREAIRTGGLPLRRAWQRPGHTYRRTVLLLDVSGSMAAYSRPLVMFAQAAVRSIRRLEVFTFGTRLTRVTNELDHWDPEAALLNTGRHVHDWSGGTRIGQSLHAFNESWGRRGMARGAAVVIISDGWERGDVAVLRHAMEQLHRIAHVVVWVNPLAGDPDYEPLAAGMAAALPTIDLFLPAHNLAALESLVLVLKALPARRGAAGPRPPR